MSKHAKTQLESDRIRLRQTLVAGGVRKELVDLAMNHATTAITLTPRRARKADRVLGATRLGGTADLPHDAPHDANYEFSFVGQFVLSDLAAHDPLSRLPIDGLLSFFVGRPTDYDDPRFIARVLHSPRGVELRATVHAEKATGLDCATALRLPAYSSHRFPQNDEHYDKAYDDLYFEPQIARHGLFEQDRRWERAVETNEQILLRLDADHAIPYDFVEASTLYFIIGEDALCEGDFSNVRLVEGSSI